ncbi:lipopolysaccharide assembly protein LapA domain-containing protein [Nitratidesulfovibrio sp. 1201_IL3209]|uniref:lipopolysaccharide assembly protein LapA domain-containing protein n=1 Tax=Nitratidesulfovibrio sp. 1201_IL3209 TaxID=3084053 RepID=UPI002FDAC8B4
MRFVKVLVLVLVFFISMMFFVQNNAVLSQTVTLKLDLFFDTAWSSIELPFYFMVLCAFLLGALLTMLLLMISRMRAGAALRRANKRIRVLEKELNSLRNLPLETARKAPEPVAAPAPVAPAEPTPAKAG